MISPDSDENCFDEIDKFSNRANSDSTEVITHIFERKCVDDELRLIKVRIKLYDMLLLKNVKII